MSRERHGADRGSMLAAPASSPAGTLNDPDHIPGQRDLRAAMYSEPILAQLTADGPKRLSAAVRVLACAVLDAPGD